MKRVFTVILALIIVFGCAGCGSTTPAPESTEVATIVTEVTETQTIETTEAVEEGADEYVMTNLGGGMKAEEFFPEVMDLRMYTPKNGYTRFEVDYKAPAGLTPVAVAFAASNHEKAPEGFAAESITYAGNKENAAYWYEAVEQTNGEVQTFAFQIETDVLEDSNGPEVHFCNENYESMSWLLIYHTQHANQITNGTPVGDITVLNTSIHGDVVAHSVTMQELNNGYVRFTIDYTAPAGCYIGFLDSPSGNKFLRYSVEETTSNKRDVLVVDIAQDKLDGVESVTVSFYEYFWEIFTENSSKIFVEVIA